MTHGEREHALLGGSSASRWINCPGSIFFYKDLPPEEPNEKAAQGTKAHEIAEIVLKDFLEHKIKGTDPDIRAHLLNFDEEMKEHAYGYRDYIWKNILEETITGKAFGLEERFILDTQLKMSGIVDFWCVYIDDKGKRVGVIGDFKYGYHVVDALKNAQLAFYASALLQEIRQGGKDLDYVKAFIYQPRTGEEKFYKETKFTAKELDTWKKKFYKAAETIYVKKIPKFKVGSWCLWCRAKPMCPKYKKELSQVTSLKLVDVDTEELPTPDRVPDETLSQIILNYDKIKNFIDACYAYGVERGKRGKSLPGLKCISGSSRRKWLDDENLVKEILNTHSVVPVKETLRGIIEVEKELKKKVGKDESSQIMSVLTGYSTPSIKLVPITDGRPAITSSIDLLDALPESPEPAPL